MPPPPQLAARPACSGLPPPQEPTAAPRWALPRSPGSPRHPGATGSEVQRGTKLSASSQPPPRGSLTTLTPRQGSRGGLSWPPASQGGAG